MFKPIIHSKGPKYDTFNVVYMGCIGARATTHDDASITTKRVCSISRSLALVKPSIRASALVRILCRYLLFPMKVYAIRGTRYHSQTNSCTLTLITTNSPPYYSAFADFHFSIFAKVDSSRRPPSEWACAFVCVSSLWNQWDLKFMLSILFGIFEIVDQKIMRISSLKTWMKKSKNGWRKLTSTFQRWGIHQQLLQTNPLAFQLKWYDDHIN